MKIIVTGKELLALAKVMKEVDNVYCTATGNEIGEKRSPKNMVNDLFNSLSKETEKYGPVEVKINKKLEYVVEIDPNFVRDLLGVGRKYTRTVVPVVAGIAAMSTTLSTDITEVLKDYSGKPEEPKQEETKEPEKQEPAEDKHSEEPVTTKDSAASTTTDGTASPKEAEKKEIIKPVYFENEEDE